MCTFTHFIVEWSCCGPTGLRFCRPSGMATFQYHFSGVCSPRSLSSWIHGLPGWSQAYWARKSFMLQEWLRPDFIAALRDLSILLCHHSSPELYTCSNVQIRGVPYIDLSAVR